MAGGVWTGPGLGKRNTVGATLCLCSTAWQVIFEWAGDTPHNVATTPTTACSDFTVVSAPADVEGSYSYTFDDTGTFHFACSVGDHCEEGQRITIIAEWS